MWSPVNVMDAGEADVGEENCWAWGANKGLQFCFISYFILLFSYSVIIQLLALWCCWSLVANWPLNVIFLFCVCKLSSLNNLLRLTSSQAAGTSGRSLSQRWLVRCQSLFFIPCHVNLFWIFLEHSFPCLLWVTSLACCSSWYPLHCDLSMLMVRKL